MADQKVRFIDISKGTGLDQSTLQSLVKGPIKEPGIGKVFKVMDFLGLTALDLINDESTAEGATRSSLKQIISLIAEEPRIPEKYKKELLNTIEEAKEATRNKIKHIIVVEDSKIQREYLQEELKKLGYTVDGARTYDEAVAKIEIKKPQLAIVDLDLADQKTGMDLLATIKQKYTPMHRLILSQTATDDQIMKATTEFGVFDYIPKGDDSMTRIKHDIYKIESIVQDGI